MVDEKRKTEKKNKIKKQDGKQFLFKKNLRAISSESKFYSEKIIIIFVRSLLCFIILSRIHNDVGGTR